MTNQGKKSLLKRIPSTIWAIGIVTLLINLSSIMIFSLSPLYITQVFGLATLELGLLEGIIESCSWFTRIFAGVVSDYLHKRKPILIVAYSLTALSRPIFALAPNIGWIYGARLSERISNGLQATPREALVGDVAPHDLKGACYGLRQTLSLVGSLLGAMGVMYLMRRTGNNYEFIFFLASIPPVLALVTLIFFVQDSPQLRSQKREKSLSKTSWKDVFKNISHLKRSYWMVVLVSAVFMVSNYSGIYMILQAEQQGLSPADVPIVMVIQNLFAMLSAFPIGRLSDSLDRRILLSIGFSLTIVSNLFLGFATGISFVIVGAALWGAQMGINQSLLLTKVADTTSQDLRGTGFGIYYVSSGVALFISNSLTGWLFQTYGPVWAFINSGIIAGVALLLLPLLKPSQKMS